MIGFQPVVPLPGIAGWRFLERTQQAQQDLFVRGPQLQRETDYFRENISSVTSAADLVADRTLLKVALGAFGLDEDLGKQAFIRKVLDEGTDDPSAFANRLVDKRYRDFATEFGFGNPLGSRIDTPGFIDRIVAGYETRQFEIAVGDSDAALRLALGFEREIGDYANSTDPDGTAWFQIMGTPPMRAVLEQAFNLPRDIGALDIDRQQGIFRDRARAMFGSSSLDVFKDPDNVEEVLRRFLAREQANAGPNSLTPGFAALSLLQSAPALGTRGLSNLLLSNA